MENECGRFLLRTLGFIRQSFHLPPSGLPETDRIFRDKKPLAQYEQLKNVNGEIHSFAARLQLHLTDAEDQGRAERVVAAVRNAMYAAKSIKDALPDLVVLSESSNDTKYAYYLTAQAVTGQVCNGITELLRDRPVDASTRLAKLYSSVTTGYTGSLQHLYRTSTTVQVREADISTMLNFNREVVTAFKSLVFAVKDYLLDREAARYFEEQPGFIH